MKTLAFDTSTEALCVAVTDGPRTLVNLRSPFRARHSDALAPALEAALAKAKMRPEDVRLVAVGTGPGSFTGLRIGVAAAKVLAYALGAKIVGVPSLEAAARPLLALSERVLVVLDARRGEFYAALAERGKAARPPFLTTPEALVRSVKKPVLVAGAAAALCRAEAERAGNANLSFHEGETLPDAGEIAAIALERASAGRFDDPFRLEPLYLRPRDCNVTKPRTAPRAR